MLYRIGITFAFVMFCLAQTANATYYKYSFYANPDADSSAVIPDHALDILYTVTLDSNKISAFNLATLNKTSTWLGGGVSLLMSYSGKSASLNSALLPGSSSLAVTNGVIELFSNKSDFLDVDFHPGAPFVDSNGLSYTPFVYGQLDVYDAQKSFDDFYLLWTTGDTRKLTGYEVAEPGSLVLLGLGLVGLLATRRRRQNI